VRAVVLSLCAPSPHGSVVALCALLQVSSDDESDESDDELEMPVDPEMEMEVDPEMETEVDPEMEPLGEDIVMAPPAIAQPVTSPAPLGVLWHSQPRLGHCSGHEATVPVGVPVTARARWPRQRDATHPVQEPEEDHVYELPNLTVPFVPPTTRRDLGFAGQRVCAYRPPGGSL
jgi:hypothetical protein